MILAIRHKGLKRLYEDDDPRGVFREHVEKLRDILARLDAAATPPDMDLPGFRLHPLKGALKGFLGRHGSRQLASDFPLCRCQRERHRLYRLPLSRRYDECR